uniref:EMI domain-containing protein n=1 Tax=Hippocampus comes TaxID=109280 RepID=A0A3Q2ZMW2_HIPCM
PGPKWVSPSVASPQRRPEGHVISDNNFIQHCKRVVTVAVACGTEKYTIKSQSPCPSGTPDCHLVMYKLSTRPLYRQQQKETTALLWRCCPGHRGDNCDDTGHLSQYRIESQAKESNIELKVLDLQFQERRVSKKHKLERLGLFKRLHARLGLVTFTSAYQEEEEEAEATSHPAVPAALPLPHMVALLMSQLQRPLQLFNHSLEQLDRRLGELARDVAELKGARRLERDLRDDYERRLDAKVEQSVRQVAALREQLESGLHSQQAMLHYNMSNLKADLDLKLKRHNKMLQVRTCTRTPRTHPHALRLVNVLVVTEKFASLQAMNATLAELKLDQELEQEQQREQEGQQEAGRQQEARVEAPAGEAHAGEAPAGEAHASSVRRLGVLLQEARARAETRQDAPSASDGELREEMKRVLAEMKRLSASFNSLLKDVIRHSDVLEILLGEEVLEFLEWPAQDQEAHSIPALKERLGALRQTSDDRCGRPQAGPAGLGWTLIGRHKCPSEIFGARQAFHCGDVRTHTHTHTHADP